MRDVHRGHAEMLVELSERRAHPDPQLRVEVRERLVHEERLGLAHDRAAHGDALALAARQRDGLPMEELGEAEQPGYLVDPATRLVLRSPAHLQAVPEILADAH